MCGFDVAKRGMVGRGEAWRWCELVWAAVARSGREVAWRSEARRGERVAWSSVWRGAGVVATGAR